MNALAPSPRAILAPMDARREPLAEAPIAAPAAPAAHSGASSGDTRLRALFDAHFDFVWRSLRRLGVPEPAARDASQQVWIVVGRRVDEILPGAERSFLFGTAMRVASETRRALGRRKESPSDDGDLDGVPASGARPDELLDRKRARETLDRVLEALPEELRVVFVLFELEELSTAEVASTLGIAAGTAASRLRRAREEFAAIVKRMKAKEGFVGGVR
jgi:RNA polymerase sigma-70 factor (ECF subfamily)